MSDARPERQLGRSRATAAVVAVCAVAFVLGPQILGDYHRFIATQSFVWIIAVLGANLLLGNAGLLSLGQGAFVAMGAYGTGYLVMQHGWPFPLAIVGSAAISTVIGSLLGLPALKIRGLYLAMVTFAYAVIVQLVLQNWTSVTGGVNGLSVAAEKWVVNPTDQVVLYHLSWITALVLAVGLRQFTRSPIGRSMQAARDSETAAEAFGISVVRCKIIAFGISAAFGSIAGSFYALNVGYVTPLAFDAFLSVNLLIAVIVGGLGSVMGSVLGAVIVFTGPELLRGLKDIEGMVLGFIMLFVVMFARKGLAGLPGQLRTRFSGPRRQAAERWKGTETAVVPALSADREEGGQC